MCTILFLFVRPWQAAPRHDVMFEGVKKYVRWAVERPTSKLLIAGGILSILTVIGFSPIPPLRFEASARSLEPKNSRAGQALQAIMDKMPTRWEPVSAIVRARDAQELHDDWQKISARWSELQKAGKIKGFTTPAALCLSPIWMEKNSIETPLRPLLNCWRTYKPLLSRTVPCPIGGGNYRKAPAGGFWW